MENEQNFEDFYRIYKGGHDKIILWFSGINEPFISENLMNYTNCDVINIKDNRNLWYMNGVMPEHNGIDDCALWISELIQSYSKKIFIGQSSGGYAAMLYGNFCHADLIIAYSPQTMNVRTGQCDSIPRNNIYNINNLYNNETNSCPVIINIGQSESDHIDDFFWDDWRQIKEFRNLPYVTLIVHPYNNHNVSGLLKSKNLLYTSIDFLIKTYLHIA